MRRKTKEQPIVALVASKDVAQVKADIHAKYGFWATDEYCADLIAFVDAMTQEMAS